MRKKTLAFIMLCFAACLVGIAEISLAIVYLCGVELGATNPVWQVILMVVIYVLFVALLFLQAVKAIKGYANGKSIARKNLFIVIVIEAILAVYMLSQILVGVVTKLNDDYFLISLSWNIPRLLLDSSLIVCCVQLLKTRQNPPPFPPK